MYIIHGGYSAAWECYNIDICTSTIYRIPHTWFLTFFFFCFILYCWSLERGALVNSLHRLSPTYTLSQSRTHIQNKYMLKTVILGPCIPCAGRKHSSTEMEIGLFMYQTRSWRWIDEWTTTSTDGNTEQQQKNMSIYAQNKKKNEFGIFNWMPIFHNGYSVCCIHCCCCRLFIDFIYFFFAFILFFLFSIHGVPINRHQTIMMLKKICHRHSNCWARWITM